MVKEKEQPDLPKSVIIILIVLAVLISALGTYYVISQMSMIRQAPVSDTPVQGGKVSVNVISPSGEGSPAQGNVSIKVTTGGNNYGRHI